MISETHSSVSTANEPRCLGGRVTFHDEGWADTLSTGPAQVVYCRCRRCQYNEDSESVLFPSPPFPSPFPSARPRESRSSHHLSPSPSPSPSLSDRLALAPYSHKASILLPLPLFLFFLLSFFPSPFSNPHLAMLSTVRASARLRSRPSPSSLGLRQAPPSLGAKRVSVGVCV